MKSLFSKYRTEIILLLIVLIVRTAAEPFIAQAENSNFLDAQFYDKIALMKTSEWNGGPPVSLSELAESSETGYYYFLSSVYFVFGHSQTIARLINIIIFSVAAVIFYRLALKLVSKSSAFLATLIFSLMPSAILFTTALLKDSLVMLLVFTGLLSLAKYLESKNNLLWLAPCLAVSLLLIMVRNYVGLFFIASAFATVLYDAFLLRSKKFIVVAVAFLLVFILLLVLTTWSHFVIARIQSFNPQWIDLHRSQNTQGQQTFLENSDLSSWGKILAYLPKGFFYFALSPFPFMIKGAGIMGLIVSFEMIFYYALLALAAFQLARKHELRNIPPFVICFFVFIILLSLLYALIEGNTVSVLRHRIQIIPFIALAAVCGLKAFLKKKSAVKT